MRSRILVTAFLVFAFAGAGTLLARGIADACGACAATCATGCCDQGRCTNGCCDDGSCAMGCCSHAAQHQAAAPTEATTRWSIVNFIDTVRVGRAFISGPVLIVHDDAKMAKGEPCTTFYRFEPGSGPREALVSFYCTPRRAKAVKDTTVTAVALDGGIKQLTEYQLAGDTEAHGIPR